MQIFQNQVTSVFSQELRRYATMLHISRNHIRNHITKRKICHSMINQDCLQEKIKQWKLSDKSSNIFFRPKTSFHHDEIIEKSPEDDSDIEEHDDIRLGKTETTPFLFVYQNGWQKRLFARYGNELTLLDAICRTTRYALTLFS